MAKKEYIERGALVQYAKEYAPAFSAVFKIIALSVPAADVVEVRHGKWSYPYDDKNSSWVECSECGADISKQDAWQYLYCPHCGAKMDGERGK